MPNNSQNGGSVSTNVKIFSKDWGSYKQLSDGTYEFQVQKDVNGYKNRIELPLAMGNKFIWGADGKTKLENFKSVRWSKVIAPNGKFGLKGGVVVKYTTGKPNQTPSGPQYKLVKVSGKDWQAKDVYYSPHNKVGDAFGLGNAVVLKHIPSGSLYWGNGNSSIKEGAVVSAAEWSKKGFVIEDNGVKYGKSDKQYPIRKKNGGSFWNEQAQTIGVIKGVSSKVTQGVEMSWDEYLLGGGKPAPGDIPGNGSGPGDGTKIGTPDPPLDGGDGGKTKGGTSGGDDDMYGAITQKQRDTAIETSAPSFQQAMKEVSKFPKPWPKYAQAAGWPLPKINLYRSVINQHYNKNAANSINGQLNWEKPKVNESTLRKIIREEISKCLKNVK